MSRIAYIVLLCSTLFSCTYEVSNPMTPEELARAIAQGGPKDERLGDQLALASLGNSIVLVPPATTGSGTFPPILPGSPPSSRATLTTILEAQARNPASPETFTVLLNSPLIDSAASAFAPSIDLKARIEWGYGGNTASADVDFLAGTQVTLVGSFVRVSGLYSIIDTLSAPPFPSITAGATVSYGTRGGTGTPAGSKWTFTRTLFLAPAGLTTVFPVPPFAKDVTVIAYDPVAPVGGSVRINFWSGKGVSGTFLTAVDQAPNDVRPYPIPGGCQGIFLVNTTATAILFSMVFGLSL